MFIFVLSVLMPVGGKREEEKKRNKGINSIYMHVCLNVDIGVSGLNLFPVKVMKKHVKSGD